MITAPFNFVPLNKEVFYPDWAETISHDVPFEDGESGIIDIKITAKSPIFVRDAKDEIAFCQHNGIHYIPSTSVKGMVRNVLEIMSFSKMSNHNSDDNTYAVRDLRNRELYMSKMTPENTFCGWLKQEGNTYIIEDCGIPGRISHSEIDKMFGIKFASHFREGKFEENNGDKKTAKYKYSLIEGKTCRSKFNGPFFSKKNKKYDKREFYNHNGEKEGTVVFTGQASSRKNSGKMGDGKGFEFIFFDSKNDLTVPSDVWKNFKFAYFDGRTTEPKESPDWTYWKEKLLLGKKVPIFFQKNGNAIAHFGLSYLYKLPYAHSVKDGIPKEHFTEKIDLAQSIFGFVNTDTKEALKGRVQFSHFKAEEPTTSLPKRTEILGTPRASYYPMYVKQYDAKRFVTFMDSNFSISGWKRYPIHKGCKVQRTQDTDNTNVGTTFTPLKEGVVFNGKVRYHNLKKSELGALLSALTFHDTKKCFHSIGLGKPLGYGKVEVTLSGIDNIQSYLKEFELQVGEKIVNWSESEQLKELFTMAMEQNNSGNSKLRYMKLTEFADNKSKTKDYLRSYSKLENIKTLQPLSLIGEEEKRAFQLQREMHLQKLKEEKLRKEEEDKIAHQVQIKLEKEQREAQQRLEKKKREEERAQEMADKIAYKKQLEAKEAAEREEKIAKKLAAGIDFSKAKDYKSIEYALRGHEKSGENISKLIECIKEVYPTLNASKSKQLRTKSKEIVKWIGKEKLYDILELEMA